MFRKRLQRREEGKIQRHFGAAAKAIEAERAKIQVTTQTAPTAESNADHAKAFRMVCSEPEKETEKVDQLYDAFLQAKQAVTRAGFSEFVRKKTKDLQEKKSCRDVEYVVEVVDGQVKLKALVKS